MSKRPAQPAPDTRPWASALVVLVIAVGVADFMRAPRGWESIALNAVLSLLVAPWAVLVLRRTGHEPVEQRRARARQVFHFSNLVLVLAFTAAKWRILLGADDPSASTSAHRSYGVALMLLLLLGVALRGGRVARLAALSADRPARLMAVSFAVATVIGALLLALPISLRDATRVSFLDALFMSASAVCVTGLATVNVAETYTFAGQVVLCALMQVGGLGIMALTAAVTLLAGRRMGVKSSAVLAEMVDATSLSELKRMLKLIVAYTLVIELLGAAVLYVQFASIPEIARTAESPGDLAGAGGPLWAALFHSVSAFCNGSMSNFRGGMVPFAGSVSVCQPIAALIVLGGLGFPVMHELVLRAEARLRKRRPRHMSLNARVSLVTTAVLLTAMAVAYFVLERGASFRALPLADQLNAAAFQSACARTSGFNLVDVAAMRPATLLLTCFAMFVGGDPGSTAGGIKTTTLAVLFAAYRGELSGAKPTLFDRTIPEAVVRRAVGVVFISVSVICFVVFALAIFERHDALALFFETVSAFSTTGISTGITPSLGVIGKLLIVATMLFGRVGPLTLALALSGRGRRTAYELPEERVMIG